ncbi:SAM-dependent methyltransferase [Marivivens niveibacter]|uniref:SAM-dependent methyltransferase n=1 Tax=Marivivens niveibacter TaxID=1930667 RepID=A0A251X2U9_9RHOB|nr:class I SAM-dependent rRNA methyltransferase [Marivivens niveibacter]OUD10735.1 SAM-dependent methyltransferase [Marivivens niveibacter]
MNTSPLPIVRLMPKADARSIRFGYPWVYSNDLVVDRRTKNIEPGAIATLQDAERQDMGVVAVNPNSRIIVRMLDRNPDAVIDQNWIAAKLARALAHRDRLFADPFYRLIHAEADGMPGVIIDRFGDLAVVQPNAAWADKLMPEITAALQDMVGVKTVIMNGSGRARALEGLEETMSITAGTAPDAPIPVPMNGAIYMADVMGGQKTGLFFDQRPNHAFAASLSKDARVLDVFSHVGGFSLAALAGGASSALAVDGSAPALSLATDGAAAMGMADKFSTRQGDAFDVLSALGSEGETFDVVVCDPPAFAPSKKALEPGLRAYERVARLAAPLVREGGYLVLCSCSHAAEITKFRNASVRGIGRAGRSAQIIHTGYAGADHPLMPQLAESGYLKSVFFRL